MRLVSQAEGRNSTGAPGSFLWRGILTDGKSSKVLRFLAMSNIANFRRKRSENLADFLRDRIRNGELTNPLPSTRSWCVQLGVGRPNLLRALKVLEYDGLVSVTGRGVSLKPQKKSRKAAVSLPRILRVIFFNRNAPHLRHDAEWVSTLSERLAVYGIHVAVESCSLERLRTLASQSNDNDLCILMAIPPEYQKLFEENKKPAFIIGYPGEGISLPYFTSDLDSAVRHATQSLLRHGFKRLIMINSSHRAAGIDKTVEVFKSTCKQWRHQPIHSEVALIWRDITSMRTCLGRIAQKLSEPCGFVVFSPISPGVLITSLMQAGIKVPEQAEIMAIEYLSEEVQFSFPVTRYAFPSESCIKHLIEVARQYFDTGNVPIIRKNVSLKMVVE